MAVTMNDVKRWLDVDEPDYPAARKALGAGAAPHLKALIEGGDLGLASKATYLASLLAGTTALPLLRAAHARGEPLLRVAAASGIRNLPARQGAQAFEMLAGDADPGVRKVALRSAVGLTAPKVVARIQALAERDPEPFVRDVARSVASSGAAPR